MIKRFFLYIKKRQGRASCFHDWQLYAIVESSERPKSRDPRAVYKVKCIKCAEKQVRTFQGVDRLQKIGRIS